MKIKTLYSAGLAALLLAVSAIHAKDDPVVFGPTKIDSPPLALVAGKIITMTGKRIVNGVILVENSKIIAIGRRDEIKIPARFKVIEQPDALVYPGFIEAHSHAGCHNMGDLHDYIQQTNLGLRTFDFLTTDHHLAVRARAAGITTLLLLPGSGNNQSGWGTLMKTWGRSSQEALIRAPGVLKIAQAGNPERGYGDLGSGWLGMNAQLRNFFQKGQDYARAWQEFAQGKRKVAPEKILSMEPFRPLFALKFPICVHTQRYQVMMATMRICGDQFGLWYFPTHSSMDGYKLAPELKTRKQFVNCGPRKYLLDSKTGRLVGIDFEYWKVIGSDQLSQNTDAPVCPQESLPLQGAMACRLGLPPSAAIKGMTLNNARLMGVQDRLGSLEKGKDADLVFWSGDPLDSRSRVLLTIINGHIAYDPKVEGQRY